MHLAKLSKATPMERIFIKDKFEFARHLATNKLQQLLHKKYKIQKAAPLRGYNRFYKSAKAIKLTFF